MKFNPFSDDIRTICDTNTDCQYITIAMDEYKKRIVVTEDNSHHVMDKIDDYHYILRDESYEDHITHIFQVNDSVISCIDSDLTILINDHKNDIWIEYDKKTRTLASTEVDLELSRNQVVALEIMKVMCR